MNNLKRALAITLGIAALIGFQSCSKSGRKTENPNIIYILADDLGYGDISAINDSSKIITPALDKLASNSMVFTDAHTSSSVCTPTRYGILTGRYSWRTSLKDWVVTGYGKPLIPAGRSTLANLLKQKNYTTACIGKWHLGWTWPGIEGGEKNVDFTGSIVDGPLNNGFDHFFGFSGSLDMPPYVWVENNMPTMEPNKFVDCIEPKYGWFREGVCAADFEHDEALPLITQKAVEYIDLKAKSDSAFFLYLPLPAPHLPILPTKEFKG
ncbi:MAG: sulfatase-like hydrolase/transferase, partial [Bacteroidales bacterium]|nr:sulfatase-like hydrolase/transferase [Bacteroidales bacterium]